MNTMKTKIWLAFTLLLALTALAVLNKNKLLYAQENTTQGPPMTAESIKAGETIYFEYCSGCHGRRADGRGPQSLNLVPKPQNLRNTQFVRYLTDNRMYASISGGVRGTAMPPFEMTITPEKRWQVIHYIRSLTADDTLTISNALSYQPVSDSAKNPVSPDATSIAEGSKLYKNFCASCHGTNADGSGVLAANLVPMPRNLVAVTSWGEKPFIDYMTDSRLYNSITNGVPGTSMQPWISVMTDAQRWSIINFLRETANKEREKSPKQ